MQIEVGVNKLCGLPASAFLRGLGANRIGFHLSWAETLVCLFNIALCTF